MKPNRRDLAKLVCGSAAGLALSPAPWKLLDDTAIWTQNWTLIPKLPHGPVETRWTTCALCPAGCGVRARTVGGVPVSLAGVPGHPRGQGALCPAGLTGHHLAWHPHRLNSGIWKGRPVAVAKAVEEVSRAVAGAGMRVAILDGRPGRAVSALYRRFLEDRPNGAYLTASRGHGATLAALGRMLGVPAGALGLDLERTRTIVSFGAPVLEGWATQANLARLRPGLRLIQIDPRHSRTASLADEWLQIRPGTEAAAALGVCRSLFQQGLAAPVAAAGLERFSLERAAAAAGVEVERLAGIARALIAGGPAVAVGGGALGEEEQTAIAAINVFTGAVGRAGGVVTRRDATPRAGRLEEVADGSLDVLLIDAAALDADIAPAMLRRKLAPGGILVVLTAHRDALAAEADAVIPAPSYLEAWSDLPAPWDAPSAGYAVAAPLLPAPAHAVDPAAFLGRLAGAEVSSESLIRARAEAIHKAGRGTLFSPGQEARAVSAFSAEDFWKALSAGACWTDDAVPQSPPRRVTLLADGGEARLEAVFEGRWKPAAGLPLALLAFTNGEMPAGHVAPPLETKLYQESDLRASGDVVFLHPETAAARGLADGSAAVLRTAGGVARVRVRCDGNARRDVIEAALAPAPAGLSGEQAGATPQVLGIATGSPTAAEIGRA